VLFVTSAALPIAHCLRYLDQPFRESMTEPAYPRWIVEAWEALLERHFRGAGDAEVSRELWFAELPAIMRIRVTTPNVMAALRKHDRGAAKPYNFAQSPILIDPPPGCTLIAPSSKHPGTGTHESIRRFTKTKASDFTISTEGSSFVLRRSRE
jgi:hypothetical protein